MKSEVQGTGASRRVGIFWPLALSCIALIAWAVYFSFAMSVVTPAWVPDWLHEYFILNTKADASTLMTTRGQFGDTFGAFNALVSTFALIGLLWTIRTQQQQLVDQDEHSRRSDLLIAQQQFQEQLYRAIDAYRELLTQIRASADLEQQSLTGRNALNEMWVRQVQELLYLERPGSSPSQSRDGRRSTIPSSVRSASAIEEYCSSLQEDDEERRRVLQAIGALWANLYIENRFQLDALFRSWYTVYRVLDTAHSYGLSPATISLYSASFRAQLSWIELAFLLVNQSALGENPKFPKACDMSNRYVVFDNLSVDGDVVVSLLRRQAEAKGPYIAIEDATLTKHAFSGDVAAAIASRIAAEVNQQAKR